MLNYSALDWKLIGAAIALTVIGILLIMSAQHYADSAFKQAYYQRQAIWFIIALAVFAAIIHVPIRLFDVGAYLMYGIALILLVLVLVVGTSRMGATRWFSFGPINLAPSDIAKVALLLALSRFLAYTRLPVTSIRRLSLSALLTAVPLALILNQPDLGTSLVFIVILFGFWFASGLSPWYLVLILTPLVSLVAASTVISWSIYFFVLVVFLALLRPGLLFSVVMVAANLASGIITPLVWGRMAEYQRLRILTFLDPGLDPRGAGYQIIQSKIAIGSGGLFGKGFLGGSQSRLDFLPERHTDFVFSVLGEEFGLFGTMIVLLLFGYILYRAIYTAGRCRSRFASLVVMGSATIILFQLVINVGMTLGIMPITGLPLPFLSYGGTSLVLAWALVGFIVSAQYRWQEY